MMRIAFGELQDVVGSPETWAARHFAKTGHPRWGYKRATVCAIYKLHRQQTSTEARRYLVRLMDQVHLTNASRRTAAEAEVDSYSEWFTAQNPMVVAIKQNVRLNLQNEVVISGEMNRLDLDVITGGYNAIVLGGERSMLSNDIRMPLIQRAVAASMGRDESLISVGVQRLDGSESHSRKFSRRQIDKAQRVVTAAILEAMSFLQKK